MPCRLILTLPYTLIHTPVTLLTPLLLHTLLDLYDYIKTYLEVLQVLSNLDILVIECSLHHTNPSPKSWPSSPTY